MRKSIKIAGFAVGTIGLFAMVIGYQNCGSGDATSGGSGSGSVSLLVSGQASSGSFSGQATGFVFLDPAQKPTPIAPQGIAGGRFNNSGFVDIALTGTNGVYIARSLGNKSFDTKAPAVNSAASVVLNSNPTAIIARDFYHPDGNLDLAVLDPNGPTPRVILIPGKGDGKFGNITTYTVQANPVSMTAGYFTKAQGINIPRMLDIVVANNSANSLTLLRSYEVNQIAGYNPETIQTVPLNGPTVVQSADLNGDGFYDLAVLHDGGQHIEIFTNNSNAEFNHVQKLWPSGAAVPNAGFVLGDFGGEGIQDLLFFDSFQASVFVSYLGQGQNGVGNGTFSSNVDASFNIFGATLTVGAVTADLNGDGKLDFIFGYQTASTSMIEVCLNAGISKIDQFKCDTYKLPSAAVKPSAIAIGDFNNDKIMDIAVANGNDSAPGTSSFYVFWGQP